MHRRRALTAAALILGVGLLGAALFAAVQYVDRGDSTCGTVLYDTRREGGCSRPMLLQTLLAGSLALTGLFLLAAPLFLRARHDARDTVVRVLSLATALVIAIVAARSLGQPRTGCGSVINRVQYEGQILSDPPGCPAFWSGQLRRGVLATVIALVLAGVALIPRKHSRAAGVLE